MRKLFAACLIVLLALPASAAIKFFTDYPNSVPLDSDFFVLQRNQSYINSSPAQVRQLWFSSPVFTGNPSFTGIMFGNGAGLTNVPFSGTNASFTYITNFDLFSTNIIVQNITNQTLITTNVTIEQPGGFTNLNLTPKTVMYADVNDAESSIPNAAGVLTNDGSGGIGFSQSLSLSELDVINFYPTNEFTGFTNAPLLSTDANGKLQNGSPLAATNVTFIAGANLTFTTNVDGSIVIASSGTISVTTVTNSTFVNTNVFISTSNAFFNLVYVTNLYSDTFTNNTFVNTNTVIITGKASVNTLIVTNVAIYGNLTNTVATASTVAAYDANKLLTNLPNAHGVLTNTASGPASFGLLQNTELANSSITIQGAAVALGGTTLAVGSAPVFDLSSSSNLLYKYTTNIVGAANFVFGKAYWTNASSNFTFPALTIDPTMLETLAVFVTNSGGSTITATINGVAGAPGHVVPAVFYCTNATVTEIDVTHFGVFWTNACVSKN